MAGRQPPKLAGANLAVGAWSNLNRRTINFQQIERIRVWNQEAQLMRGRPVQLWMPVNSATLNTVPCTCLKATDQTSDRPCFSCHGSTRIPGYLKFLHETLFFASAEASAMILEDVVLETEIKPHRLGLSPGALTGTIITAAKPYDASGVSRASDVVWSTKVDYALRDASSTVSVAYSTDDGATWLPLSVINDQLTKPVGQGTLRFRITLSRVDVNNEGPAFEILRVRRPRPEDVFRLITMQRPDYDPLNPGILVLRTPVALAQLLDPIRGRQSDNVNDRGWTPPLDWYDVTLPRDTEVSRIDSRDADPRPFYEISGGVQAPRRYVMTNINYSEELGLMTKQLWDDRLSQAGEHLRLVF